MAAGINQFPHNVFFRDDLEFIAKMVDKTALERLQHVAHTPFKRLSYTEAIDILEKVVADGKKKFEFPVSMKCHAPHLGDAHPAVLGCHLPDSTLLRCLRQRCKRCLRAAERRLPYAATSMAQKQPSPACSLPDLPACMWILVGVGRSSTTC